MVLTSSVFCAREISYFFEEMAEYQVEYTGNQRIDEQKWISFMIPVGLVHSGHYVFQSLVQDIKSRCTSLNFLNEHNMRLRYLDDEDNWINLNNDDERGFQEFWQSARTVPEREFKRIKVKAGVLGSPIQAVPSRANSSNTNVQFDASTPYVSSPAETRTSNSLDFGKSTATRNTALSSTNSNPVDRILSKKLASVESAKKVLEHAKVQKDNFERELCRAVLHNSGSLSICGRCHLKVGHTRRNCDGEDYTSVMLCGVIEKHPNDKAERRKLSQQVTKCQTEVANLESDYNNKVKAYKAVEDSFARKIEADIVASDPERYIVNGVKNWVLLNKHVAPLQKKCNGKLPPRQGITHL